MSDAGSDGSIETHRRTCPFCEAMCGLTITTEGDRVAEIRGDDTDPFSRGYLCPKGVALQDVHRDPDRLRAPLVRRGDGWDEVTWQEALSVAADGLADVRERGDSRSVGVYLGNPTTHRYGVTFAALELLEALDTRNVFSTASMDHLPHMFAAYQMFGHRALLPVPDVDHTDFFLILGANPLVSNGSLMSAPDMRRRLKELRGRGGRVVVVDPRRTRTAAAADDHLAIRPGRDVLLLLALVHVVFEEGLADDDGLQGLLRGTGAIREAAREFPPEHVAPATGLDPERIRRLARNFAGAPSAVCYGRLGICVQEFGGLCCWLAVVLNAVTGNLDRRGGSMFSTPAADLVRLADRLGETGSFDRWRSRIRGLPEFAGEMPIATLVEEMDTAGEGRIRGLVTVAGNPVLSAPNGARLERTLSSLDHMVAVDFYLNETTRHADVVLPPTSPLEVDHYDLLLNALAVRNVARYSEPVFDRDPGARHDWEILVDLSAGIGRRRGGPAGWAAWARSRLVRLVTPRRLLALLIRLGPHGAGLGPFGSGLTLEQLRREGRAVDLGPLEEGRLRRHLEARDRAVRLAPAPMLADLQRVRRRFDTLEADGGTTTPEGEPGAGDRAAAAVDAEAGGTRDRRRREAGGRPGGRARLRLIGRRQLRGNNSWMHNMARLMKGADRCTLLVHPADARRLGIVDGGLVRVRSRTGSAVLPAEVSDEMREGVVSLPHGFGHDRPGTRLEEASTKPGVSANDLTDERRVDELTGTAVFNGVEVTLEPVARR